jgi:hypothetical protein
LVERANPAGAVAVITDNLSSHSSFSTRAWLAEHPRIRQVFIPKGACWLNLGGGMVAVNSARMVGQLPRLSDHAAAILWAAW